jgi:glutamyl-tRNA synthetase
LPAYAHIPLILGPGRDKLSKRHGAVSVVEYQKAGYLPEAMLNFLARMGWSYDDKQEIFSKSELIEKFSLEGVTKSGAVYDLKKLNHLNAIYIRQRPLGEVVDLSIPFLVEVGLVRNEDLPARREALAAMIAQEKERLEHLSQIVEKLRFYFEEPANLEEIAALLKKRPEVIPQIERYATFLEKNFSPDAAGLEESARHFAETEGVALKEITQPIRIALTGRTATPPLFAVMAILGKDASRARLKRALAAARG